LLEPWGVALELKCVQQIVRLIRIREAERPNVV
jgi:hypothetical protein